MRYTHVVFDIDNTLINTTGAVLHGLQRALRDITGEHWDISRLLPVLGIPGLTAPNQISPSAAPVWTGQILFNWIFHSVHLSAIVGISI